MWKTIRYKKNGKPLWDINDNGKVYTYNGDKLISYHYNRIEHPYYCFTLYGETFYPHILVAKAFPEICGEWFDGCEVHHIDGNSLNNKASNLIVCTKEQHSEYHRLLKEKKQQFAKGQFNIKDIDTFCKIVDKSYPIQFYCRNIKMNNENQAPIEICFRVNGKRHLVTTEYSCNPSDFKLNKVSSEFNNYRNKLLKMIAL